MSAKDAGGSARARRMSGLAMLGVITAVLMSVLAACGSSANAPTGAAPLPTTGAAPTPTTGGAPTPSTGGAPTPTTGTAPPRSARPNPYRQFDQQVASLLVRQAAWQAPKRIQVDQTARVGLVIGDPGRLKSQIRQLVPGSQQRRAGTVQVGSTIGVQLLADPNDASVTPKDAIDESIGEHTALLWTWYVNAKHPNSGLLLTAEIVTKMPGGHVLRKELALTIPVDRTVQYTLYQIFSNWATWAAIVTALGGMAGWIWRQRKRRQANKSPGGKSKNNRKPRKPQTQP